MLIERSRIPGRKYISVSDWSKPACLAFENLYTKSGTNPPSPPHTQPIAQMGALSRYLLQDPEVTPDEQYLELKFL